MISFERLCKYAKTNCIKAVIIACDMFDSKKATIKTMDRVFNSIKNCPNVDFLYLSGNHDALTINEDEYVFPDNFKLFQNEWTSFSYENVNIIGAYFDKYNSKTLFDTISLDKTLINILVMHGQIAGYKSNEDAEIISLPKLSEKGVDYLALVHIHEYSIGSIDKRGVYAYSGTLEGRGFDELGKKGFIEISVENCTLNHKFVEFLVEKIIKLISIFHLILTFMTLLKVLKKI